MKKKLHLLLLFAFSISFSQNVSVSQAISITNKQSMLSQRMANEKMSKINEGNSETLSVSSTSIIQFEQNIEILGGASFHPKIVKELKTVELLWDGYKKAILNDRTSLNRKMILFNDIILEASERANKALLLDASVKNLYPYNVDSLNFVPAFIAANETKVLSQKLPFYLNSYASKLFTYDSENISKRVLDLVTKMDINIEAISKMSGENENVTASIQNVTTSWAAIKSSLNGILADGKLTTGNSPVSTKLSGLCNQLLKDADFLVRTLKSTSDIN